MRRKAIKSRDILRVSILPTVPIVPIVPTVPTIIPRILEISKYYADKCAKVYNTNSFNVLSKKAPWDHRNWRYFVELYKLSTKHNWDFKDYIDAQFLRAKHWNTFYKRPLPNQLCSPKGIEYYYSKINA